MRTNNIKNGERIVCQNCQDIFSVYDSHPHGRLCSWECKLIWDNKGASDVQMEVAIHNAFVESKNRTK